MTRRPLRFALALFGGLAFAAACTSFGSTASGTPDAATSGCSPLWPRLDPNRNCVLPPALADGLCVNDTTNLQGLYVVCAVGPDDQIFVKAVSGDATLGGIGWTFAPANLVVTRQGLPRANAAAALACEVALADAGPLGPPSCGD